MDTSDYLERLPRFVVVLLALDVLVLAAYALIFPPDPLTQLLVVSPGLVLALGVAYWLVYRGGWTRLRGRRTTR